LRLTGQEADAEEISQEGFVRAYRRLSSFRGEAHFRSWLFRILINLHRDRIRSQRRRENREECLSQNVAYNQDVGAELQAQELQDLLHEKIRLLPERQREVMQLHGEKALGYREIAQILGCSYEDVKMNLCLARKRLRQDMGAYL
ncbi:MAG: sigma-70 family RNA polymerase sigma factor, partial [Planctomycetota bacterium]|nr:sigma-70 family RNA polymerase sigma factor [Planctomycetota bacterium]